MSSMWNADSDRDYYGQSLEDYFDDELELDEQPEPPFLAVGDEVYELGFDEPIKRFFSPQRAHRYAQLRCTGIGHDQAEAQLELWDRERRCQGCMTHFAPMTETRYCDRCVELLIQNALWCDTCQVPRWISGTCAGCKPKEKK